MAWIRQFYFEQHKELQSQWMLISQQRIIMTNAAGGCFFIDCNRLNFDDAEILFASFPIILNDEWKILFREKCWFDFFFISLLFNGQMNMNEFYSVFKGAVLPDRVPEQWNQVQFNDFRSDILTQVCPFWTFYTIIIHEICNHLFSVIPLHKQILLRHIREPWT